MLTEIPVPPGVVQAGTTYEQKNRWTDANLVRWVNGRLRPVGGWSKITSTPLTGTPTNLLAWKATTGSNELIWTAIGTNSKLYALGDGIYNDVTPTGLVAGNAASSIGLGFGAADFGEEDWGDARSGSGLRIGSNNWALDNWGTTLIACSYADGKVYEFDPTSLPISAATQITNAPIDNQSALVTDQRFLVCFGAGGNRRKVQWSDREDYTVWTPASTNLAGSIELQTAAEIQQAVKVAGQVLILTQTDAHRMEFLGAPLVYGIERIGENCGTLSQRAAIAAENRVFWMGRDGFYVYDGYVKPMPCDVHDFVFDNINYFQRDQITSGHNAAFNEVWWFFPSGATSAPDRYVAYNYLENYWTVGRMERTAWMDGGLWSYPVAATFDGHLYYQEYGWTASGADRKSDVWALTGPIQISQGDKVMAVNQLIIDEDAATSGAVGVSFQLRTNQNQTATTVGPFTAGSNGYTDCRFTARQVEIKVQAQRDERFDYGILRADLRAGGRR